MNLTASESFRLGAFEIAPARGEITRDGATVRVEPKVMAVLVVLARRQGETISREALLDEVWDGRAVTDDALTRCISALRRIFRSGGGVEIKALPKLGYVLTVEAATPGTKPSSVEQPVRASWLGLTLLVLAVGTTLLFALRGTTPVDPRDDARVRPLTAMPGLELHPALTPSGGQVAFVHRDPGGQWDLYVRSLAGGEPQRLTNDAAREQHPAWSSTSDEIVYVRGEGEACDLMRLAVPGGTPRAIAPCGAAFVRSLDWSPDGAILVLTVADTRLEPGRLVFAALSGKPPQVPLDPALSAEDARFSADGTLIALTLSPAIGAEDIYTLDLRTNERRRLTRDNAKVHGLDWTTDGLAIVYASNRAGSFGLHRVSLAGGPPTSLMPALQDIESPSVAGGRTAYEMWTESGRLNALALEQARTPLRLPPDSTRLEWHPDVAADGAMTFVSDRDGAPEVWLWQSGAARQLTDFGDAYIHTPKFSRDGKRIVFSAPRDGRFNLFVVDREGRQRRLTEGPFNDMSPAWSRDDAALYFASDREDGWRVWKLDLATGAQTRVSNAPARAVYVSGERELLVVDPVEGGLRRVQLDRPDEATVAIADLAPSDWANVFVADENIFYIRREPPDRAVLRRLDRMTGRDEAIRELDDFYFRSGLAGHHGSLIYATTKVEDVSLMLLERRSLALN
jgi:Tol biopolymer transport system component/DNA-binding winged helix-turn-helix (wHTH) protein